MTHRVTVAPCLAVLVAAAWGADAPAAKTGKPLDAAFLRTYAETRGFMLGRPVQARPTPDGKAVLFLRAEPKKPKLSLYEFDVATGKTRELLTPEAVLKGAQERLTPEEKARRERMRVSLGGFTHYQLSDDGRLILLSLSGKLYVYDRGARTVRELATGQGTLLDPQLSPDGRKVAYVLDHDVYVYDLATNTQSRVTRGGTAIKTHGLAEFVAQEEMDRHSGYWWSPDSRQIAYEEADHQGVEVWHVADPARPEQPPSEQFYPRPGKKNVAVRLGIVGIDGGETVWVDWDREKYEYLAAVRWDEAGPLTIQVQDRLQQELLLLKVDPATGKTTKLLEEKDAAWVNLDQQVPRWLDGGKEFVWISASKGAPAIELRDADGDPRRVLVPPPPRDLELVHVDAQHGRVALAAGADPTERRIFAVGREGVRIHKDGPPGLDILSDKAAWATAAFAQDYRTYVLTSTTLERMPRSTVQNEQGFAGQLPSLAIEPDFTPNVTIQKVGDGEGFYTAVVRPRDFDPKKKYPVIVYVYGGPTAQTVTRAMGPWLLRQWLADQGFIVVSVDNRGTPGRGRVWERAIYQKFGEVPLNDQVAGLRALGRQFPEMDLERVGIVGWSFGGYMSALALLKRPDVFKAAVAGAPVTDWEDYDTHYTERYLGLPKVQGDVYRQSSLLPLAGNLTRPLLLVHGTADDNVYFRHTLRLTDALFRAGSSFEVLPLPSLTHMVPDPVVTERLWTRIAGHFARHLGGGR